MKVLTSFLKYDGAVHTLLEFLTDDENTVPEHSVLEYVLEHSHRQRAIFYGYRFVCLIVRNHGIFDNELQPRTAAQLFICYPRLVHILLRYGGLYSYSEYVVENEYEGKRLGWSHLEHGARICGDIFSIIIQKRVNGSFEFRYRICESGCLLMKDMPQMKIGYLTVPRQRAKRMEVLRQLDAYVPGLVDFFCCPLSLKHSCKLIVRKALYKKWQLPHGIYKLPVPNLMKNYRFEGWLMVDI